MAPDIRAHPVALCVSLALVSIYALRTVKSYITGRLPPGPKGIPILGNLFQLSLTPWKQFEVWKNQYGTSTHPSVIFDTDFVLNTGPLTYLTLGGQGILVLNTHQVAADLLDHRGHIYSDRPRGTTQHHDFGSRLTAVCLTAMGVYTRLPDPYLGSLISESECPLISSSSNWRRVAAKIK